MSLQSLASSATVVLLYAMGGVPFAVWAGMSTYGAVRGDSDGDEAPKRASRTRTAFLVVLPLLFIAVYVFSGVGGVKQDEFSTAQEPVSDWGPYMFLMLPPCVGLMLGHGVAMLVARRNVANRR